jgi:hypothetical protein
MIFDKSSSISNLIEKHMICVLVKIHSIYIVLIQSNEITFTKFGFTTKIKFID